MALRNSKLFLWPEVPVNLSLGFPAGYKDDKKNHKAQEFYSEIKRIALLKLGRNHCSKVHYQDTKKLDISKQRPSQLFSPEFAFQINFKGCGETASICFLVRNAVPLLGSVTLCYRISHGCSVMSY